MGGPRRVEGLGLRAWDSGFRNWSLEGAGLQLYAKTHKTHETHLRGLGFRTRDRPLGSLQEGRVGGSHQKSEFSFVAHGIRTQVGSGSKHIWNSEHVPRPSVTQMALFIFLD